MSASKSGRLAEFMRRLGSAPAASTFESAFELVGHTISAVEDEMTTIPFDLAVSMDQSRTDGRMYPPRMDDVRTVSNREDIKRFRTRGHTLLIGENGAIQIWDVATRVLLFAKRGSDGEGI